MLCSAYRHWRRRYRNRRLSHSPVSFSPTASRRISRFWRPGLTKIQGSKSSWFQDPIRHKCLLLALLDRVLVGTRVQDHPRLGRDRRVVGRMGLGKAIRVQLSSVRRRLVHFRARQVHVVNSKCIARCSSLQGPALRQCRNHLPPMLIDKGRVCRCVGLLSVMKRALMHVDQVGVSFTIHHGPNLQLRWLNRSCPPVLTLRQ